MYFIYISYNNKEIAITGDKHSCHFDYLLYERRNFIRLTNYIFKRKIYSSIQNFNHYILCEFKKLFEQPKYHNKIFHQFLKN